ncbi:MAG: phosphoglyceromutase [Robiginitomaculum sp.]|nr:MAG: phosphoglyceromutase [Robiginitomaculum sp.]
MIRIFLAIIILASLSPPSRADQPQKNQSRLILVTIDGLRWQELFRGADPELVSDSKYNHDQEEALTPFLKNDDRAATLMPFMTNVIGNDGVIIGNRDAGSCARVTNAWWFSYPGYNEILTGKADDNINSNASIDNPNITFLEWLNGQNEFAKSVYAFGSWDAFPAIINANRSHLPVNAGFMPLDGNPSAELDVLNRLQGEVAHPFDTVRHDAFTHEFSRYTMRTKAPRVLYIAYGETDDFAHEGRYDQVLYSAQRTDKFIRELWTAVQADPQWEGHTTMIITTDHGRGQTPKEAWQHHASPLATQGYLKSLNTYPDGIVGSDAVWMAAIGPNINPSAGKAYTMAHCATSSQVAATALKALGLNWQDFDPTIGKPLDVFKH